MNSNILQLKQQLKDELTQNILPFWMDKMVDETQGGFYGRMTGENDIVSTAPKGAILNARILWTFSSAYRLLKKPEYLITATRAKDYLLQYFWDTKNGGIFWQLDSEGKPIDTKKQIYAQGFAIYGLSEYARATGDTEALDKAVQLYELIEKYSFDTKLNGYFEAFSCQWGEIADMRLSDKDANEKKTMNSHLHILEPYTNLYRVWPSAQLKQSLHNLITLFLDKILDSTGHLQLFFDEQWYSKKNIVSYGHDIEASWLLYEAAVELGDEALLHRVIVVVPAIVKAASEGLQEDGSLIYEKDEDTAHVEADRHWWVQAEAVVGYWYAYQLTGNEAYLQKTENCWQYIQNHLIDRENGEWFWSFKTDGSVNMTDDKAGFWKCPYHNGRMCMELIAGILD